MPSQTLQPATEEELHDAITEAYTAKSALAIEGNGTKRGLGFNVVAQALSLKAISGIASYEPEEMVITVKAGTPLDLVQQALTAKRQCLAFEPSSWSPLWGSAAQATIGGTIAAAVHGPRRFASGGPRDHLLGFSAINGKGERFKAGGKVVKNVTGYDLSKLAAGSFGTLFVMTELTLRAIPAAEATIGIVIEGLSVSDALVRLRKLAMSPLDPSALSFQSATSSEPSLTLCRFEGDKQGAIARAEEAQNRLGPGARLMSEADTIKVFTRIKQVAPLFDTGANLWRASLPPTLASQFIALLQPEKFLADGAGGTVWVQSNSTGIHALAAQCGGHALHVRHQVNASAENEIFQPLDPVMAHLTMRIKNAFDPNRVLNPGRMYKEI